LSLESPHIGTLTLIRSAETELCSLMSATIRITRYKDVEELAFSAEAQDVFAELSIFSDHVEPGELVGQRFSVPARYDESRRRVATFLYREHEDLYELKDSFAAVLGGDPDAFRVRWTGKVQGLEYDEIRGELDVGLEIDGVFRLQPIREIAYRQKYLNFGPSPGVRIATGAAAGLVAGLAFPWLGVCFGTGIGFLSGLVWAERSWNAWNLRRVT
jgi:hypothetical protein